MRVKFLDGPLEGTLAEFQNDELFLKVFADQDMQDVVCCYQCVGAIYGSGTKLFRLLGEERSEHGIAWMLPLSKIKDRGKLELTELDKRLLHQCRISSE